MPALVRSRTTINPLCMRPKPPLLTERATQKEILLGSNRDCDVQPPSYRRSRGYAALTREYHAVALVFFCKRESTKPTVHDPHLRGLAAITLKYTCP